MLHTKTGLATVASHDNEPSEIKARYYGSDSDKLLQRFKNDAGQKCYLIGAAYKLVSHVSDDGKRSKKRKLISVTYGYVPNPSLDVSFLALCSKTKERIRLVGQIMPVDHESTISGEPSSPVSVTDSSTVQQSISLPHVQDIVTASEESTKATSSIDSDQSAAEKMARVQRQLAVFKREIEIVMAQSMAGIDPPVSIATTGYMSKRSHAAIYRDIKKKVLPQPTKIGRSSVFPYSVVKAYAAGQLVRGAA
ncbi:hypothetical protein MCEMSHM24_03595 [Comamonadaceae bacterium]